MRLTKKGILTDPLSGDGAPDPVARPRSSDFLLANWHCQLAEIDEDYTVGDLVSLLRDVDDIENVSPLLGCDVSTFLAEADRPRSPNDEQPIQYVRVSNVADLTEYEADPDHPDQPMSWMDDDEAGDQDRLDTGIATLTGERPPQKLVDATSDDPITGEPRLRRLRLDQPHGRWRPPYCLTRQFEGWGKWDDPYSGYFRDHPHIDPARYAGTYALDFTPLSALLHLPLRYDPAIRFRSEIGGVSDVLFETELTITLGEFLHAIFGEVGFHGSPADRDEALASLIERSEAVRARDRDLDGTAP